MRAARNILRNIILISFVICALLALSVASSASGSSVSILGKTPEQIIEESFDSEVANRALKNELDKKLPLELEANVRIDSSKYVLSYIYSVTGLENRTAEKILNYKKSTPNIYLPIYYVTEDDSSVIGAFIISYDKKSNGYKADFSPQLSQQFLDHGKTDRVNIVDIIDDYKKSGLLCDGNYAAVQSADSVGFFTEHVIVVDADTTKIIDCFGIADGSLYPRETVVYERDEYCALRENIELEGGFNFPWAQLGWLALGVLGFILACVLLVVGVIYLISCKIGKRMDARQEEKRKIKNSEEE